MSNRELTPISYLVLGLVTSGAATSYELKQKVASSVGFMWSFPHSALYAEPPRLVGLGLLADQREEHGRRRRTFTITDRGRAELEHWLREPTSEPPELRDLGLLKLFFSNLINADEVGALAEAQAAAHRRRLVLYESIEAEKHEQHRLNPFPFATLRMGLMCERAFVAFWEQIAAEPPEAEEPGAAVTTPSATPSASRAGHARAGRG